MRTRALVVYQRIMACRYKRINGCLQVIELAKLANDPYGDRC